LAVGAHSIAAAYLGDTNDAKSTSAALTQNVSKAPSTVTVISKPQVTTVGQGAVTFVVTVSPNTATGTVTLTKDATALAPAATLSGGSATFSVASLPAGVYQVTSVYSGDGNTLGSSGSVTQTVNKEATTVTVTSAKPAGVTAVSPETIFTATINPATATGTVTFTASPDTPALTSGPVAVSGGVAKWTAAVPVTLQTITAVYSGDENFLTSTGSIKVGG
jgi:hypothetical protein